jgi:type II secretory pathway pseudopilin PulG
MKRFVRPLNSNGFTITEAMVVVTLVAIMTGFSYSGFSSWIVRERARSAANQYASYLKEARIRSIEKHTPHAVVYSYGANEYNLFKDNNGNFLFEPDIEVTEPDEPEIEIAKVQTGKEFRGVIGKNAGIKAGTELKIGFNVRGFPQLEGSTQSDSILFLAANVDPGSINSVSDCHGVDKGLCCAVNISYASIKVVCSDDK